MPNEEDTLAHPEQPHFLLPAWLWAVVLLPPMLLSRAERANDSIGDFNYRLDVLGRTNGALRVQIPQDPNSPHPPPPAVPPDSVDTSVVYRLAGGNRNASPEPVLVKLGITDNISTQVLDGLKEGDTVITGIPSRIEIPQRRGLF